MKRNLNGDGCWNCIYEHCGARGSDNYPCTAHMKHDISYTSDNTSIEVDEFKIINCHNSSAIFNNKDYVEYSEELQQAWDKSQPMKIRVEYDFERAEERGYVKIDSYCPSCGKGVGGTMFNYCSSCGQRLKS